MLEVLERRNIVVLALKADQQCGDICSADALRTRLGLSEAPERAVAHLAVSGRVVVLIDQVDALSLSLARDQAALNTVLELVGRLRQVPGVSIVISCRTFDRSTDPRLNRLEIGQEFMLSPLAPDEISSVLECVGIQYDELSPSTAALLRTPLHLDLFVSLAERTSEGGTDLRGVTSLQQLYGLLWDETVLRNEPNGPTSSARVSVLRDATDRMHTSQQTTIPRTALLENSDQGVQAATQWLASAGVLVQHGPLWGFLHQTFFDYCFARFFVEAGRELVAFVEGTDQGLFVRSQVVHVLAYLRGTEHPTYFVSLRELLIAPAFRPHLRALIWKWFGALSNLSMHERDLMRRFLNDDKSRDRAIRAMHGNFAWMRHVPGESAEQYGLLALLSERPPMEIERNVLPYLASVIDGLDSQATVCALVETWFEQAAPWPEYASQLAKRVRNWTHPEARTLYRRFLAHVPLDQRMELFQLDDLAKLYPVFGTELLGVLFERFRQRYLERNTRADRLRGIEAVFAETDTYPIEEALKIVADACPLECSRVLLAFLHALLDDEERWIAETHRPGEGTEDGSEYANDPLSSSWAGRSAIRKMLCDAIVRALIVVHTIDDQFVEEAIDRLSNRPFTTAQLLTARILRRLLPSSVKRSAEFLAADERRLRLGAESLSTRSLLRDLASHATKAELELVQQLILRVTGRISWRAEWGNPTWALQRRGADQLHLLRAIPAALLSSTSQDRLGELERKFPDLVTVYHSSRSEGGFVGSPIDSISSDKMSDAAWLRAMDRYTGGVEHRAFLRGGASELSQVLEVKVKVDPVRFHRLFMRAPESLEFRYVEAALSGLGESQCDPELLVDIVRRFVLARPADVRFERVPRSVAWALDHIVERHSVFPSDILDALEATVRASMGEDEQFYLKSETAHIQSATLNTDRCCALSTLLRALLAVDPLSPPERAWAVLEKLVIEPSLVLRAAAMESLALLLQADRARATSLFEALVSSTPALCRWPGYHRFLYSAAFGQFGRLLPYVEAMLESDDPKVREGGGELVALGHISDSWTENDTARNAVDRLAERVFDGEAAMRLGASHVCAHNWSNHSGEKCATGLLRLSSDLDIEVRRAVGHVAYSFREGDLSSRQEFLLAFAGSHAALSASHEFAEFLWVNASSNAPLALEVGVRLAENVHAQDNHQRERGGEYLVRLALRVHTDPFADATVRKRAMDLFDLLLDRYTWDADKVLSDWDRL